MSDRPLSFPRGWLRFVDETLPSYVKANYSPRAAWKERDFSSKDVQFFGQGVVELSQLFTLDRPQFGRLSLRSYFGHAKFRSSYLLYFVPLQAAKFLSLFHRHAPAVAQAVRWAQQADPTLRLPLRIADLGAGPGTASLALLMHLRERWEPEQLPPIEFIWCDSDLKIMQDGRALLQELALQLWGDSHASRISVQLHRMDWWQSASKLPDRLDLVLMGHVLNEGPTVQRSRYGLAVLPPANEKTQHSDGWSEFKPLQARRLRKRLRSAQRLTTPTPEAPSLDQPLDPDSEVEQDLPEIPREESREDRFWRELWPKCAGAGVLVLEPAARESSQRLSQLRDRLLQKLYSQSPGALWGPCLHMEACPLSTGRTWCHFSWPIEIPGRWFRELSLVLGSERQWLKMSYAWFAAPNHRAPAPPTHARRVISDPLVPVTQRDRLRFSAVQPVPFLLCEPNEPRKWLGPPHHHRGDIVHLERPGTFAQEHRPKPIPVRRQVRSFQPRPNDRGQ